MWQVDYEPKSCTMRHRIDDRSMTDWDNICKTMQNKPHNNYKQMHFFLLPRAAAELNMTDTSNCLSIGAKNTNKWKQMEKKKDPLIFKSHDSFPCDINDIKSERWSIFPPVLVRTTCMMSLPDNEKK